MTVEGDIDVVTGANLDAAAASAINALGVRSGKAQRLATAITVAEKLKGSGDRVYLFRQRSDQAAVGFVRVGKRKLFLYDADTKLHEMQPICCLDFYVSESMQRRGIGRQLFDKMLRAESVSSPSQLAFDKPSPKLLSFLSKNFCLDRPIAQTNNFVIFLEFFQVSPGGPKAAKLLQQCQPHARVKTHHHSADIASLLSSGSGEPLASTRESSARQTDTSQQDHNAMLSSTTPGSAAILKNAHLYRQEDIEAIRLADESLSQVNKRIEEREATIAALEKELQALETARDEFHFGRPGKDGFSKSELIRKIHSKK